MYFVVRVRTRVRTRGAGPHVVTVARHAGTFQAHAGQGAGEVNDAAAADVNLKRKHLPVSTIAHTRGIKT